MSNVATEQYKNNMLSKITIHTAPNFMPCIKVLEINSEDVRDILVQGLREQLRHKSNTFQVCEMNMAPNGDKSYLLLPVDDELKYMEGVIFNKLIKDSESRDTLLVLANKILSSLDGYAINVATDKLDELRKKGQLSYSGTDH